VKIRLVAVSAASLALAACSSQPSEPTLLPGELAAGTAKITVDGKDTGTTDAVQCTPAGSLTTVGTGDQNSGVTVLVSNKDQLTADTVAINNVGGFTGSYNAGLGGTAKVTMTGRTYDITGTADGFNTANPSFRTSGTFAIKVSC
jgi:lipoprotein LpqH